MLRMHPIINLHHMSNDFAAPCGLDETCNLAASHDLDETHDLAGSHDLVETHNLAASRDLDERRDVATLRDSVNLPVVKEVEPCLGNVALEQKIILYEARIPFIKVK